MQFSCPMGPGSSTLERAVTVQMFALPTGSPQNSCVLIDDNDIEGSDAARSEGGDTGLGALRPELRGPLLAVLSDTGQAVSPDPGDVPASFSFLIYKTSLPVS